MRVQLKASDVVGELNAKKLEATGWKDGDWLEVESFSNDKYFGFNVILPDGQILPVSRLSILAIEA
jgi:hypothetical protein